MTRISPVDTPLGLQSTRDSDDSNAQSGLDKSLIDTDLSLTDSNESFQTDWHLESRSGGDSVGDWSVGSRFGGGLITASSSAKGQAHLAGLSTGQSSSPSESDFFSSFSSNQLIGASQFDGGESDFWGWYGLNSIESPAGETWFDPDVDTSNSHCSNYLIGHSPIITSPQSILDSPPSSLDLNFGSYPSAQPFSRTDPFVVDSSSTAGIDQIDYANLFGLKLDPSFADDQLFNGGSISTGLLTAQPISADPSTSTATGYRDSAAELDALLCSPLDVSPAVTSVGDFSAALFSPDEAYSQLATPQLDFSSLNVDNDITSASLFGALPGQDLLVNTSPYPGMVSIKEEPEEDQLESTPATPELEDDSAKPSAPVYNTRKRKTTADLADLEPTSSPFAEPSPPSTKRTRRAPSSAPPVLALDAPIQARRYNGDSKTSRKVLPKAIERSLGKDARNRDEDDLRAEVDSRRAQNTLAARKSRQRKAEEVNGLKAENAELRERLAAYEERFGRL